MITCPEALCLPATSAENPQPFSDEAYAGFLNAMEQILPPNTEAPYSAQAINQASNLLWEQQDILIASLNYKRCVPPTLKLYNRMFDLAFLHPATNTAEAADDARDATRIVLYQSLPNLQDALNRWPSAESYHEALHLVNRDIWLPEPDRYELVDFMVRNLEPALDVSGLHMASGGTNAGFDEKLSLTLALCSIEEYVDVYEAVLARGNVDQQLRARLLGDKLRGEIRKIGKPFLERIGLSYDSLSSVWGWGFPQRKLFIYEANNLHTMQELETMRPGACKELHDKFNIRHFGRYPVDVLLAQHDKRNETDMPYGIMITAEYDDNGAFFEMKNAVGEFSDKLQNIGRTLRIYEAEQPLSAARRIMESATRHGKPEFGILRAHGHTDAFQVSSGRNGFITNNDIQSLPLENMARYMQDGMEWIMLSCSTGGRTRSRFWHKRTKPIAQMLSEKLPNQDFIAPEYDVSVEELTPYISHDGKLHIVPDLREARGIHRPSTFSGGKLAAKSRFD